MSAVLSTAQRRLATACVVALAVPSLLEITLLSRHRLTRRSALLGTRHGRRAPRPSARRARTS
eukprot:9286548-Pyramimonas_sp.AAC.1